MVVLEILFSLVVILFFTGIACVVYAKRRTGQIIAEAYQRARQRSEE